MAMEINGLIANIGETVATGACESATKRIVEPHMPATPASAMITTPRFGPDRSFFTLRAAMRAIIVVPNSVEKKDTTRGDEISVTRYRARV